jgi:hypothetical protein
MLPLCLRLAVRKYHLTILISSIISKYRGEHILESAPFLPGPSQSGIMLPHPSGIRRPLCAVSSGKRRGIVVIAMCLCPSLRTRSFLRVK